MNKQLLLEISLDMIRDEPLSEEGQQLKKIVTEIDLTKSFFICGIPYCDGFFRTFGHKLSRNQYLYLLQRFEVEVECGDANIEFDNKTTEGNKNDE